MCLLCLRLMPCHDAISGLSVWRCVSLSLAGEGEYVEFANECICDGPVENWLQNVVDSMKAGLSSEFRKAIPTYDDMPRTQWIYKYSAQNTIVVTRTFFTQEVNEAFEELEEGEWL